MIEILTYNKKLENENAFIKPSGEILKVDGSFEEFADKYCNGICFHTLVDAKYHSKALAMEKRKKVNIYQSTKLTENEREILNQWNIRYAATKNDLLINFMIQVLHYDMIDSKNKIITTSDLRPYHKFYHYEENGWTITRLDHIIFDNVTNSFKKVECDKMLNSNDKKYIRTRYQKRPQ